MKGKLNWPDDPELILKFERSWFEKAKNSCGLDEKLFDASKICDVAEESRVKFPVEKANEGDLQIRVNRFYWEAS